MLYDPKWEVETETKTVEPWRLVLRKAADIVRERGLAKWTQRATDGSVCIQGAISIAACGEPYGDGPLYCEATRAVTRQLIERGVVTKDILSYGNAEWNNKKERTVEEVIDVLEAAANA